MSKAKQRFIASLPDGYTAELASGKDGDGRTVYWINFESPNESGSLPGIGCPNYPTPKKAWRAAPSHWPAHLPPLKPVEVEADLLVLGDVVDFYGRDLKLQGREWRNGVLVRVVLESADYPAESVTASAPAPPAEPAPDYEALVRAWYAERRPGIDPIVRKPGGGGYWIGHKMPNGLYGSDDLLVSPTPELAWQAAWEYLSSLPPAPDAPPADETAQRERMERVLPDRWLVRVVAVIFDQDGRGMYRGPDCPTLAAAYAAAADWLEERNAPPAPFRARDENYALLQREVAHLEQLRRDDYSEIRALREQARVLRDAVCQVRSAVPQRMVGHWVEHATLYADITAALSACDAALTQPAIAALEVTE